MLLRVEQVGTEVEEKHEKWRTGLSTKCNQGAIIRVEEMAAQQAAKTSSMKVM